jgi:hypothetical protein
LSAATIFDPIKPAPPVTSNMPHPASMDAQLCLNPGGQATSVDGCGEDCGGQL